MKGCFKIIKLINFCFQDIKNKKTFLIKMMYTSSDFARIKSEGFDYKLPVATVELLRRLASMVGADAQTLNQVFTRQSRPEKQGQDKIISEIKSGLNKLSDETFNEIAPQIMSRVKMLDDVKMGTELILDTASGNAFFAKLYAKLLGTSPETQEQIQTRSALHAERVLAGDATCRAMTTFLANMVTEGGLHKQVTIELVCRFQDAIDANVGNSEKRKLIEEVAEHVVELGEWLPKERMAEMKKKTPKEFPGISMKAHFKFLDYKEKSIQKKSPW